MCSQFIPELSFMSQDVTMSQAKRDFVNGVITGADILKSPMSTVWCIRFRTRAPGGQSWLVDARRREGREFKTLDAAAAALREVGFSVEQLASLP